MAHNIDMTNGRANMAFLGSREDIWHRLGQAMEQGQSIEAWATAAGLAWHAVKVPLFANVSSLGLIDTANGSLPLRGVKLPQVALVRSDNAAPLGIATDTYIPHQPAQVLEWFKDYVGVDSRFELDTAGSLKGGQIIWAQAKFNGDMQIAGEAHKARLLMSTSFDSTAATINKATMTRVVCNNTLSAALADGGKSIVRTRHNTKFDPAKVQAELSRIASGFDAYKVMAEAMAVATMSQTDTSQFFKAILDIPFDAERKDISGRKMNQFDALRSAYAKTQNEGTQAGTQWCALNAVTRYVDHDRTTRGGSSNDEARALSNEFGSGAKLKAKAVQLLLGRDGSYIEQEIETDGPDAPVTGGNVSDVLSMMGH